MNCSNEKIKVTLLGDSIRVIGYGPKVPALLGESFEVYQPNDNCRFAKYTLRGLKEWENGIEGSRIVHWNNGLWDVCKFFGEELFTSIDEFVTNMARIADILVSRHEKVIFATITPVPKESTERNNDDIIRYNNALIPVLEDKGIIINDLYETMAQDVDKYIRKDDQVHPTEAGIEVCSKQVADIIKKTASTLK